MLHVDGMKGAGQGPTGSEGDTGPPPSHALGLQGSSLPSTVAGAWQLFGGVPLCREIC